MIIFGIAHLEVHEQPSMIFSLWFQWSMQRRRSLIGFILQLFGLCDGDIEHVFDRLELLVRNVGALAKSRVIVEFCLLSNECLLWAISKGIVLLLKWPNWWCLLLAWPLRRAQCLGQGHWSCNALARWSWSLTLALCLCIFLPFKIYSYVAETLNVRNILFKVSRSTDWTSTYGACWQVWYWNIVSWVALSPHIFLFHSEVLRRSLLGCFDSARALLAGFELHSSLDVSFSRRDL